MRALCLMAALLLSGTASAEEDKSRARVLIDRGNDALRDAKYSDALEAYREAFSLYPSPKIRLNIAEVHNQLGQFVKAIEQYEAYLEETEGETALRRAADERRDQLLPKVGTVEITGPIGAVATVDGAEVGPVPIKMRLDPGRHTVRVTLSDHKPFVAELMSAPGSTDIVAATLKTRSARPPPIVMDTKTEVRPDDGGIATKWWFWTVIGAVVVAGVTTGVVLGTRSGDDTLPEGELGTFGTGGWDKF